MLLIFFSLAEVQDWSSETVKHSVTMEDSGFLLVFLLKRRLLESQ